MARFGWMARFGAGSKRATENAAVAPMPAFGMAGAEAKASATGPVIALQTHGRPAWTPRDYAALAREGFARNAVVFRSVRMIAEAAASVPLLLYEGVAEAADHPLLGEERAQAVGQQALGQAQLVHGVAHPREVLLAEARAELSQLHRGRPPCSAWPSPRPARS